MANSCPDCGTSMEFEERSVRLRTGVCPSCAKEFAFVEGATVSKHLGSPPAGAETSPSPEGEEGELAAGVDSGLECEECGSPLTVEPGENGTLKVGCPECETVAVFVPKGEEGRPERSPPRDRRRFDQEGPRGRPCRQCGAPLRFSTGDDGMLIGECASCGNRFTLPPRPGGRGGGGGFRSGPGYGRRDFRPGRREGSRYSSRGPGRRPYRKDGRRDRAGDNDSEERPRRRRRSDEE